MEPGELVAIVGAVGSGKSSLLAACLGELRCVGGGHSLQGTVSLCAQQPWLASGTLRENVLFGKPYLLASTAFFSSFLGTLPGAAVYLTEL